MDKHDILELVVVAVGIICLAVAIPIWLKVQKAWKQEKKKKHDSVHLTHENTQQ
jgi:uncharacterized membrane protein YidH (DUF202 family)